MSRTYNTPPAILRTKIVELGRGFGNATKALLLWPWTALKMGFESVLSGGRPEYPMVDYRPQQFFGLGSITQDLLDKAERGRLCGLPADPFETLAGSAALDDETPAAKHSFRKFHAVRHGEH